MRLFCCFLVVARAAQGCDGVPEAGPEQGGVRRAQVSAVAGLPEVIGRGGREEEGRVLGHDFRVLFVVVVVGGCGGGVAVVVVAFYGVCC